MWKLEVVKKNMYEEEEIQKKYEGADVKRKKKDKNKKEEEEAETNAEKRKKEKWKRKERKNGGRLQKRQKKSN